MNEPNADRPQRHIRSFVLRAGRMTAGQQRAWNELWPQLGIEFQGQPLDLDVRFGRSAPRMLEIGFGTGDALVAFAQQHPDWNCVGIEVHPPGVGYMMLRAQELGLTNVRALCRDAVEVITQGLATHSIDEVHIFFPDPWHKKRHHKRRLIQTPFVDLLARTIKHGGVLRLATDWEDYAKQMLAVMTAHSEFENLASGPESLSGYVARAEHRPLTRFERRGHRLGHGVWDLAFRRK